MTPEHSKVWSRAEFEARLADLCLRRGAPGLPQSQRDSDVLFKSVAIDLGDARRSEREINELLKRWLAEVGSALETDHVSLRRALVDAGWLERTGDGREYWRGDGRGRAVRFAPDVDHASCREVIRRAQEAAEKKKRDRAGAA